MSISAMKNLSALTATIIVTDRKKQDLIIKKAKKLYELHSRSMNIKLLPRCCDFKLLEEKSKEYNPELSNQQEKRKSR